MKIVELDYQNIQSINDDFSLCLGYFDGVHRGHQKLLKEAKNKSSYKTAILTFDQPISNLIDNGKSKEVITSKDDKIRIVNKLVFDYYFILKIDREFLNYSPTEFIEKVLMKLGPKDIYVGTDYHYGKMAKGDNLLLQQYFDIHEVDLLEIDGSKVSTSEINYLIKNGEIKKANSLLGHNYQVHGTIVEGHHRGKSIGFPTQNIALSSKYVLPKFGVYKVIAYISGLPHLALANVGVHPTVGKENEPLIEVHIPNYSSDDYGKSIYVEFLDFVRDEKHFDSIESLKNQIANDVKTILG